MKSLRWIFAFGFILATAGLMADDDPYKGWTTDQLKAELTKLKKQVADLQAKSSTASTDYSTDSSATTDANGVTKVDDFEKEIPAFGGSWWEGADQNKMGTTISPDPYERIKGGSPQSPGYCAGMKGHLGPSEEPWPWATLTLATGKEGAPADLSMYKAIRFYTQGDGKEHLVRLQKTSVKDYADYEAHFVSPKKWTQVTISLDKFAQPDWGARVEKIFNDVKNIAFVPGASDADYDFKIDDLELLK